MSAKHKRLSPELEQQAFDMVLQGNKLKTIAEALGFGSIQSFQRYQMSHPEFMELLERARLLECVSIEEEFRHILEVYGPDSARVQADILSKVLKWRDPKKYGDKTQIDMSINIDIAGSLDRAERRVTELATTNILQLTNKTQD